MKITYTKYYDYYLPDLLIPTEETVTYGRFGRMCKFRSVSTTCTEV